MGVAQARVPVVLATGLICLVAGIGIGGGGMMLFGKDLGLTGEPERSSSGPPGGGNPMAMMMMGKGGPPGGKGGMRGKGPSAKSQLTSLVVKLDQLTTKPLHLELSSAEKKAIRAELEGLEDPKKELSEEEAKKRLDALLDVLKDEKETLVAAGYRWPGERGGPGGGMMNPPMTPPNPFWIQPNSGHLTAVQERLAKDSK